MSEKKAYNPSNIESKWYSYWLENQFFSSTPDEREPFTIVIPPPNVTGVLHMGHMLNNTIQDVLIRRARMQGYNACWVPGTDHASIATEAKVVRLLREKGITKKDITREAFLEHAFAWKEKYGGIILEQLKRLGASCDWDRTRFTMEPKLSKAVIQSFIDLYQRGYIYRDWKIVNWDPAAKTTLSNEEVVRKEEQSTLYYVKYKIVGEEQSIVVATTRPETIMGDTAVCVHPNDDRYTAYHGKKLVVPVVNREVSVITDTYVDKEFGTGALKITPAHDANDYEIGQKHALDVIDIFNDDGTLNEKAEVFIGEDRFVAREKVVDYLKANDLLEKMEVILNNVGYSERNPDTVVEPKLSLQWFVNMKDLVKPALENVLNDEIQFYPGKFKKVYKHWLENIRDWPISRQLWWGHQIPAYYFDEDKYVVASSKEDAIKQAKEKYGLVLEEQDIKQDEDVLDTWFSSWLWPISVFDGYEGSKDFDYYYPTNVLVTGWDIIFFWVARMIMAGYEFKGEKPFREVYFTGMVRDGQRRKMSKSLGNSPDLLKLMDTYSADGVRFGILSSSAAGNDLLFDEKLCEQGRNFCNKLWNASRLIKGWHVEDINTSQANEIATQWFESSLYKVFNHVEALLKEYKLSEALMQLYNFAWSDFCSWYLEFIKPAYGEPIDRSTYDKTIFFFEQILKVLHPFIPFLTEELWHTVASRDAKDSITVSAWPSAHAYDEHMIEKGELAKNMITSVREVRAKYQVKHKDLIQVYQLGNFTPVYDNFEPLILKLAGISSIEVVDEDMAGKESFILKGQQFYIDLGIEIDTSEQREELQKELEYTKGFVLSVEKKLNNEKFVSNAPEQVVAREKQKLQDGLSKIKLLEESLSKLV